MGVSGRHASAGRYRGDDGDAHGERADGGAVDRAPGSSGCISERSTTPGSRRSLLGPPTGTTRGTTWARPEFRVLGPALGEDMGQSNQLAVRHLGDATADRAPSGI
jgi:hypothetical protein